MRSRCCLSPLSAWRTFLVLYFRRTSKSRILEAPSQPVCNPTNSPDDCSLHSRCGMYSAGCASYTAGCGNPFTLWVTNSARRAVIIQWPQTSTQCQVPQKFQMRPCRELITFIRGFCHVKLVQKSSGAAWLGSRARKVGCSVTPLSKVLSYRQGWNQDTERQNWMEGR